MVAAQGRTVDALVQYGDEGRRSLRKAPGRWQATFDPEISEWGNPSAGMGRNAILNT